jgi:hypothetical protein
LSCRRTGAAGAIAGAGGGTVVGVDGPQEPTLSSYEVEVAGPLIVCSAQFALALLCSAVTARMITSLYSSVLPSISL